MEQDGKPISCRGQKRTSRMMRSIQPHTNTGTHKEKREKLDNMNVGESNDRIDRKDQAMDIEFGRDMVDEDYDERDIMLRKYDDDASISSLNTIALRRDNWNRSAAVSASVAIFGILAAGLFLGFGISASNREQERRFELVATTLAVEFQLAWNDYEVASRWLHQACQFHPIDRSDFRNIYEYLTASLEVQVSG
jgi:hypothetical protein